ncbi:putative carbonic anhydrase-like protein 1 [Dreissena polymorpha]|uniref:putative carbonic anhydrase-like protein 1 n=1 Tax=Dreissena polymorpha TaxID=45954 RepID=UPI0022644A6C|nr:putative carbonic anhydrase-like protein 1 [Dreissena polymorpha]
MTVLAMCPESDHWGGWWGYDGYSSGPSRWGDNEDWTICKTGKHQSPINIEPQTLLYDPNLQPLKLEAAAISGLFRNNKKDLTFLVNGHGFGVNISSGPLSYRYRLYQIKLHFGRQNQTGSEHTVDGRGFDGELHFMAYNTELYANYTEAQVSPRGIAILAVFLTTGEHDNAAFKTLQERFFIIDKPDSCTDIENFPLADLLPESTDHFITYSGSLTQPGCRETVQWVIINKPIYISHQQLNDLRNIPYQEWMDSNTRPVMPLNNRNVRTNINFRKRSRLCSMDVSKKYQVNAELWRR